MHGGIPDQAIGKPAGRVAQALPGARNGRSAPRVRPGPECTTSPAPRSADTSAVVSRRVKNYRRCSRIQLVARLGRMDRIFWRRSAVLTSSGAASTTPKTTRHKRTNTAGARRLGGGVSPAFDAGKATPGITPPTGAGIVPGGQPCSPEWSTDAGATLSDPEEDILALVGDALTLSLALVRDALTLCPRPPPTPDLLQGTRWELGMVGLVISPTGIRCAPVERDKGGDSRADSPSPGRATSSTLLHWTTSPPRRGDPPPPKVHPRAGNRSAPRPRRG